MKREDALVFQSCESEAEIMHEEKSDENFLNFYKQALIFYSYQRCGEARHVS